jgi:hypothetical protein
LSLAAGTLASGTVSRQNGPPFVQPYVGGYSGRLTMHQHNGETERQRLDFPLDSVTLPTDNSSAVLSLKVRTMPLLHNQCRSPRSRLQGLGTCRASIC